MFKILYLLEKKNTYCVAFSFWPLARHHHSIDAFLRLVAPSTSREVLGYEDSCLATTLSSGCSYKLSPRENRVPMNFCRLSLQEPMYLEIYMTFCNP